MTAVQSQALEETLLLLAEARERAERAAQEIREAGGQEHVAEAFERVDRELLAMHRQLMDGTYFHAPAASERQLALDAA